MSESGCYVYGAGGHARVVIDVLLALGIAVLGLIDDRPDSRHPHFAVREGVRLVGEARFAPLDAPAILAIGSNAERAQIAQLLPHAQFATVCHPSAVVSESAHVGAGTVVFHGAIVQTGASIGEHVVVNTGASIDHDCVVGDFAHISPRAVLLGNVHIGAGCQIGAGAIVLPEVHVAPWSTVGAGAVVLHDVAEGVTVVGNPARVVPGRHGQPRPTT